MDKQVKLSDSFHVSSLSIQLSDFNNAHHFEARNKKIHNSIGYILKGRVEISTLTETITAKEGDLIFIPEGARYISHWDGDPQISFFSLHFLMQKNTPSFWRTMPIQMITTTDNDSIGRMIAAIYQLADGDESEIMRAYSLFYSIAEQILPCMNKTHSVVMPAPLIAAVKYIDENYVRIASVAQIAQACYISESRLYHLFREFLGTTPISYLNNLRIQTAMEMLRDTDLSIQIIAEQLNFHSEYYFRKTFIKYTGVLPSKFRKML